MSGERASVILRATSARVGNGNFDKKKEKKLTHAHIMRNEYYSAARAFIMIFLALHLAGSACASFVLHKCVRVCVCIHNIQKSL